MQSRANSGEGYSCIGIVMVCIYFLFVAAMCYLCYALMTVPTTQNLNRNQEALTVEKIWTVDEQFSIWIDDVSEISGEIVRKEYGEFTETDGKRYFDISFSFQNIGFPGLKKGDRWETDYLAVDVSAHTTAQDGESRGNKLQISAQEVYDTAWQDGAGVPVTVGITSLGNHVIVAVEETESTFCVCFCVDVEEPSAEALWYYAQDFLISISD